jgi:hypothetical protein
MRHRILKHEIRLYMFQHIAAIAPPPRVPSVCSDDELMQIEVYQKLQRQFANAHAVICQFFVSVTLSIFFYHMKNSLSDAFVSKLCKQLSLRHHTSIQSSSDPFFE